MDGQTIMLAFGLTLIAGIASGIGGLCSLMYKRTNEQFLSMALGLSAGVMIYLSFMEMLQTSIVYLSGVMNSKLGAWLAILSFFAGVALISIIDRIVPTGDNPHEFPNFEALNLSGEYKNRRLLRAGILTALAISLHNFPEGLATLITSIKQPSLGVIVALAVAIHNIPEGMAVAVPVFYATGDKKKAFLLSLFSGLSEPLGALLGYLILLPFVNDMVFGMLFAFVAGIMVFISLDELLPAAREYGKHHTSMLGFVIGMGIMAVSLLMLA